MPGKDSQGIWVPNLLKLGLKESETSVFFSQLNLEFKIKVYIAKKKRNKKDHLFRKCKNMVYMYYLGHIISYCIKKVEKRLKNTKPRLFKILRCLLFNLFICFLNFVCRAGGGCQL